MTRTHAPSPLPPAQPPEGAHPFDEAMALHREGDGLLHGHTHAAYANAVGPYGGITAAVLLRAVLDHPDCLGEPIALTVNFAGPVGDGPFAIDAKPVRTNRSTQHWVVTQTRTDGDAAGAPASTATVVTAHRRSTWSATDAPLPTVPPAASLPRVQRPGQIPAWLHRYEMRPITGGLPAVWDEREQSSLTRMWVRDDPLRALDFPGLAALADSFLPALWLRRAKRTLIGTVSMSVYFHASAQHLADTADGFLMAQAQGQAFHHGFFDHTGQLWNEAGQLLATTHQIVYFKD